MKCPMCGKEAQDTSKEWDFSRYHVKLFKCEKCSKTFKAYYEKGKLSYTIPKSK